MIEEGTILKHYIEKGVAITLQTELLNMTPFTILEEQEVIRTVIPAHPTKPKNPSKILYIYFVALSTLALTSCPAATTLSFAASPAATRLVLAVSTPDLAFSASAFSRPPQFQ